MIGHTLTARARSDNFDEQGYLEGNPDVARDVQKGLWKSGRAHFDAFGHREGRMLRWASSILDRPKRVKLDRIRGILRDDMPYTETLSHFNFLSDELKAEFNLIDTNNVASNNYDGFILDMIERHSHGLILDCGAGKRPIYYENVVNFEIVPYDTTDVLGVGEVLPFRDHSFNAVISVAVLEHVKDPFRCAREIIRVLKPGGELFCCVPFLQPLHGYPHHYYNMTHQGLRNLFDDDLTIDSLEVIPSILPIWALTWFLRSWADGLNGATREAFLGMRVQDLLGDPITYLNDPFVTQLSTEKNLELASACLLRAHKPA
jgi:SAM-dependent methyltransferase